jgi:hypothetical protein
MRDARPQSVGRRLGLPLPNCHFRTNGNLGNVVGSWIPASVGMTERRSPKRTEISGITLEQCSGVSTVFGHHQPPPGPNPSHPNLRIRLSFLRIRLRANMAFFFFLTLGLSYARLFLTSARTPDFCSCLLNRLKAFSNGSSSLTTTPGMRVRSFPKKVQPRDSD